MYLNTCDTQLPQKRKHEEYHDPDYATINPASAAKRLCDAGGAPASTSTTSTPNVLNTIEDEHNAKYKKITEIIGREFQREIQFKHQQLEEIDDRLEKAFHMLNRLRYAIVAEYYRKQTLLLPPSDACSVRGTQTLYDDESKGPQMALHPSLKKIIGKKPKSFDEILRACPTRAAAQTAKHTILVKSQSHKKREKRLRQLIRDEGIVIDHSKEQSITTSALQQLGAADIVAKSSSKHTKNTSATPSTQTSAPSRVRPPAAVKSLNAARLNNKTKHLIVVGNTSKYIGSDADEQNIQTTNKSFTHKWLVYVQAKDPKTPLELFVKKVRFFLHYSYRPNDVVDVYSPPYQIARRGWGEFPVRIQMFFQESLKQKPVQLVHNLVLDKTLSGLQTLGAETLVEIWLSSQVEVSNSLACKKELSNTEIKLEHKKPTSTITTPSALESNHKSSYPQSKDIDDNLFEFLNKIEETPTSICADIEKIQPTVMVTEPITQIPHSDVKSRNTVTIDAKRINISKPPISANSCGVINRVFKSPAVELNSTTSKNTNAINLNTIKQPQTTANNVKSFLQDNNNLKANMIKTPNFLRIGTNPQVGNASINKSKILPNNKALIVSKGKLISANNAPVLNAVPSMVVPTIRPNLIQSLGTKRILQKKLVQLIDADGNIKYLQMLVATSTVPPVASSNTGPIISTVPNVKLNIQVNNKCTKSTIAPSFIHKPPAANLNTTESKTGKAENVPKETSTTSKACNLKLLPSSLPRSANSKSFNNNQSKNVVFQKEGKVFIIDPMQVKLKQQQKQQVSLLKPQISLLKQKPQQQTPTICDHDYVPTPPIHSTVKKIEETNSKISPARSSITSSKFANFITKTPFQAQTTVPHLHLGIKQARANAGNMLELSQQKRLELEQQFLAEQFVSIRQAVEYLLRRLPLINTTTTNIPGANSIFPFLNFSLKQFNNLPAFKQRAQEWLRAKLTSKLLRSHAGLKKSNGHLQFTTDSLWSTREIVMFARFYAYTPPIKGLNKNKAVSESSRFTDLVKHELKNEKHMHYETITTNARVINWIESVTKNMTAQEVNAADNQIIDVLNVDRNEDEEFKSRQQDSPLKFSNRKDMLYLSIPDNLTDASELASDLCKEASMRLQPEEITTNVIHPMSQTIMARCLSLFIEKLLRQVIGSKALKQSIESSTLSNSYLMKTIEPQDIAQVINEQPEYDFLSNRHLGTTKTNDEFAENT